MVGPFNKRGSSTPKMGHGTPKVGPGILTPAIPAGEAEQGHSSLLPSSPCPQARAGGRAPSSSAGCRRRWQTRAARSSSSTPSTGSCSLAAGSGRGAAPVSSAAPLGSQGLVPGTKSAPRPLPNPTAVPPWCWGLQARSAPARPRGTLPESTSSRPLSHASTKSFTLVFLADLRHLHQWGIRGHVGQGEAAPVDAEGDRRVHWREVHQLLLLLERREDVQRAHPQIQVGREERRRVGGGGLPRVPAHRCVWWWSRALEM